MNVTKRIIKLISSDKFYIFILAAIVLQACWYAFNFQPTILDEGRHFGAVQYFAQSWNPFRDFQSEQWDHLGVLTRDTSYAYYYVLGLLLRLVQLFTDTVMTQVIMLRLVHTGLFVGTVVVYRRLFERIHVPRHLSHLVLFFLALTPSVAILGGAITYDIPAFLLCGLVMLQAVKIIKSDKPTKNQWLALTTYVLFAILIKYSTLAFIVPVALLVVFDSIKHKKALPINGGIRTAEVLLFVGIILIAGLIIERHVINQLQYGGINAKCSQLLSEERCLNNYTQQRSIIALQNKPADFTPKSYGTYFVQDWAPNMVRSQVRLNPWDAPVKILHAVYLVAFVAGTALVLLYGRLFWSNKYYRLLLIVTVVFTAVLFVKLYNAYTSLGVVVATSSRYLLPVQPLFMLLVIISVNELLKKHTYIKLAGLVLLLLVYTQGGGVLTYRMHAPNEYKWNATSQ